MFEYIKQPAEIITLSADFSSVLSSLDTINSAVTTVIVKDSLGVDVTATLFIASSIGVTGNIVTLRIQAGTDNSDYTVTVNTGLTTLNNTYELDLFLKVREYGQFLVSLSAIKPMLGLTDTTQDSYLLELTKAASTLVEGETKKTFFRRNLTDTYYPSEGSPVLLLDSYPVLSVSSVVVDGITIAPVTLSVPNYKFSEDGELTLLDGSIFPAGPLSTVITYTTGYNSVPADISFAISIIVSSNFSSKIKEGISKETMGDYSISYLNMSASETAAVKKIINRYRTRMF